MIARLDLNYKTILTDADGNTEIVFSVPVNNKPQAWRIKEEVNSRRAQGKPEILSVAMDWKRKKRSLDANAYCWKLCTMIADAVGISKEEVYKQNIREGNEYTPLPIKAEAVEEFARIWGHRGLGWFIDIVDDSKIEGYKLIFAYHGSSTYDTASMSKLIDRIIQDANSIGIETLSERELSLLKERWDEKYTSKREEMLPIW